MSKLTLALAAALALSAAPLAAQSPKVPFAGVSFGIDTTAADVGDIVRLVRAYLTGPGVVSDSAARAAGLLRAGSPADGPTGDVSRGWAYQGFPAHVVGVGSAGPGDSVYVVKVLYASSDSAGAVNPLALQRLYAVRVPRAPYGWQLMGALPRLTRSWQRYDAGRIRFRYQPGFRPDRARAAAAGAFVDSVARLFAVQPPDHIDYYVTASPDDYLRAVGLDFFPLPSGRGTATGGQAGKDMVLAGDPSLREGYLHELVHVVLARSCCGNAVAAEGIATWLAGSKGRAAPELYRLLAQYQREHPRVTLRRLLDDDVGGVWGQAETDALYATDALLVATIHRRGGIPAVRAFSAIGRSTDAILAGIRERIPEAAPDVEAWWRRAAGEAAAAPPR